mmetsp:Transcript_44979/g.105076  ORF Transcript_44979/g.105076 Transcript_44979/m.105076 type:complete len:234 (+) Transcript_44979:1170-1871(+)
MLGVRKYHEPTVPATVACTTAFAHCTVQKKERPRRKRTGNSPCSCDVYETAAAQTNTHPSCTRSAAAATYTVAGYSCTISATVASKWIENSTRCRLNMRKRMHPAQLRRDSKPSVMPAALPCTSNQMPLASARVHEPPAPIQMSACAPARSSTSQAVASVTLTVAATESITTICRERVAKDGSPCSWRTSSSCCAWKRTWTLFATAMTMTERSCSAKSRANGKSRYTPVEPKR